MKGKLHSFYRIFDDSGGISKEQYYWFAHNRRRRPEISITRVFLESDLNLSGHLKFKVERGRLAWRSTHLLAWRLVDAGFDRVGVQRLILQRTVDQNMIDEANSVEKHILWPPAECTIAKRRKNQDLDGLPGDPDLVRKRKVSTSHGGGLKYIRPMQMLGKDWHSDGEDEGEDSLGESSIELHHKPGIKKGAKTTGKAKAKVGKGISPTPS